MVAVLTQRLNCWRCGKLLAEAVTPPYRIVCGKCHAPNQKGLDNTEK